MPLRDHVVLVGASALARSTADELTQRNISFVRVPATESGTSSDPATVRGTPCDEAVLKKADVEHVRMVVAALDDDNDNAMVVLLAKDLNPAVQVLAIVSDAPAIRRLKLAGADAVFADCCREPTGSEHRRRRAVPVELTDLFAGSRA